MTPYNEKYKTDSIKADSRIVVAKDWQIGKWEHDSQKIQLFYNYFIEV